jgi:DNA gyrase subunit A
VEPACELLVVTAHGYGKRTPFEDYPAKGRATGGVQTISQKNLETTGRIVSARAVHEDDDITLITTNGQSLRLKVAEVRQSGRSTMGTRLIHLREGDSVASVARLAAKDIALPGEEKANGKAKNGKEATQETAEEAVAEVSSNSKAE